MTTTAELTLFVHIAETGNLSQAARDLDLQPATASASLKRLEAQLKCRLFERTTRSMRLTQQGETFLAYCRQALALLAEGEAALEAGDGAIRGLLRLSAPADFGRNVLQPWLNEFQAAYPAVSITLQCSDYHSDLFREPVDMAFRYGKLEDTSLVAAYLADNRRRVVASPAYLARHGTPDTAHALQEHNCLLHNLNQGQSNTWRFETPKGQLAVTVRGDRMADDGGIVRQWAVDGVGIAYKSELDVRADLAAGRLVTLLDQLRGDDWPLWVVYPHRASVAPSARKLVEFVKTKLSAA
ncbi:MAG TPA: LysR family transcriptional regulator [Burkholderiaceae bacterium]